MVRSNGTLRQCRRLAPPAVGLILGGMLSGCGSDGLTSGKVVDPSHSYWALELNHHAVALASPDHAQGGDDTLTLVATPRTVDGTPLSGLPAPTYISADPEKVTVGSDGVLRAFAPTDPGVVVPVVATLTAGNLKHTDTVLVAVLTVDPRPVLASFSIHPAPNNAGYADSAKVGRGITSLTTTCFALPTWTHTPQDCRVLLPVAVLDASGDTIPGVPVAFRSSDEDAALVNSAIDKNYPGKVVLTSRPPGDQVTFYASTTVFGTTKADTLPLRIGWPVVAVNVVSRTGFDFPVLRVGAGAIVSWRSDAPFNIDINFADPTNVVEVGQPPPNFWSAGAAFYFCQALILCADAGNAVMVPNPLNSGQSQVLRRFPVPGTYDYSSTALGGASGRIIVLDER